MAGAATLSLGYFAVRTKHTYPQTPIPGVFSYMGQTPGCPLLRHFPNGDKPPEPLPWGYFTIQTKHTFLTSYPGQAPVPSSPKISSFLERDGGYDSAAASRKGCSRLLASGWAPKTIILARYPTKCTFRRPN